MTLLHKSSILGVILGAVLIHALWRDYVAFTATGRSLWWLVLEFAVVSLVFVFVLLLERLFPKPNLEAVTGARAVAGVLVVLAVFFPALVVGVYLDELLDLYVSFGALFASISLVIATQLIGVRLSRPDSLDSSSAFAPDCDRSRSDSSPPN